MRQAVLEGLLYFIQLAHMGEKRLELQLADDSD